MELDSRKKSRRDRMMCSKSFEMQEVKEIGQKKAEESRSFPILWMGIIEDVLEITLFCYTIHLLLLEFLKGEKIITTGFSMGTTTW